MKNRDRVIRKLALQMFGMVKRMWLESQREKMKGGFDLSESEFLTLDALEQVDSLSVGDLRRRVGVLPAQMSRVIKALEQRYDEKLVVCAINAQDKRKIDVAITPRGRRAVDAYRHARIARSVRMLESLSDEDIETYIALMQKFEVSHTPGQEGKSA